MPVVGGPDEVIGIVSWVDLLLNPETPTDQLVRPPLSISPRATVLEALTRLRAERRAMAIVRDGDSGRPLGIVTMKDLVEPLTGRLAAW
jgi:CBS domain containing-hemolysin-like protein